MPAPKLANLRNVELVHAGTWDLASGKATTFSRADLIAAVAALACPAVHRPLLKLGHLDGRVPHVSEDGQPTIGWVGNLHTVLDGHGLVGDFQGLPAWMTEVDENGNFVLASAFPMRSLEGSFGFRCQLGHHHPFVLTAVALLGETPPGIGTLSSLQDIAALYSGVAASVGRAGTPVTVTIHASSRESTVPDPTPIMVTASVTLDDLRDEFRESASYDQWITEVVLNPLQLIVMDDGSSSLLRVPVTIGADDSITFGTAVPVKVTYVDDTEDADEQRIAASAQRIVFASRAESRPGRRQVRAADPTPTQTPASAPVSPSTPAPTVPATAVPEPTDPKEEPVPIMGDIRSRLGLPDDADDAAVLAALDERMQPAAPPDPTPEPGAVAPPAVPAQAPTPESAPEPVKELVAASAKPAEPAQPVTASVSKGDFDAALAEIGRLSKELATIHTRAQADEKAAFFDGAVRAGRLAPAERKDWETRYDRSPDLVREIVTAKAAGSAVPVGGPVGYAAGEPEAPEENFDEFFSPAALKALEGAKN